MSPPQFGVSDSVSETRSIITDVLARRLLDEMLALDPAKRLTATAALDHDYFYANPPPMELGK